MRTLTSSGLGNILATELTDMEKCIDCQLEESVDVTHLIQRIFTNTTTQLLFGRRYNDKGKCIFNSSEIYILLSGLG